MGETALRKALDGYKTVYMVYRNFADRTRVEYLNDLEDLVRYLEKLGISTAEKLELSKIERYLADLENKGFAGATRRRKAIVIRSFLSFLYNDGYIKSNLAKYLIPPYADNKLPTFLTEVEYNRLRTACTGNKRDAAIVELLLQTGIRLSELTRLTVEDIEFTNENGFVRIKGNRGKDDRLLPLNNKAFRTLRDYISDRPKGVGSILFLNRFDKPLGDRGVQKLIKKHLTRAELGKASVHTLRHTFGAHHAMKGTSVETLQDVLGFKDKRSTVVYLSLAKDAAAKEIQRNAL